MGEAIRPPLPLSHSRDAICRVRGRPFFRVFGLGWVLCLGMFFVGSWGREAWGKVCSGRVVASVVVVVVLGKW